MASSRKVTSKTEVKETPASPKPAPAPKASKASNVGEVFVTAAKKYEDGVNAELSAMDKKFVSLCKSADDEIKKIKLTEDVDKIAAQINKCLEKLKKDGDSIWSELVAKNKFRDLYNQYYKEVGAAWNQTSGSDISPYVLYGVLQSIAYVAGIAAYFSDLVPVKTK